MDSISVSTFIKSVLYKYRVHLFVLIIALFIGLTFSHPAMILNDEWVSLNQLNQLHAGHQVLVNEGKYGLLENGTMSRYFGKKSNLLGYSIALPLISLPSFWIIDIFSEHFPFLILYLWAFLAVLIILFMDVFFKRYTTIGKWNLVPFLYSGTFVLFFVNLFYYASFPISYSDAFPEIMAIVFSNVVMFSLIAVMVYEINQCIFSEPIYSFFGVVVTLSCSSYILWMTFCKDHLLTAFLFTTVVLWVIEYQKARDYWYLTLAFIFTGLLAWARPELAFWVFLALCVYCGWILLSLWHNSSFKGNCLKILSAPFFTLIGSIPFFTNNFMVTGNPFLPAWILWDQDIIRVESTSAISGNIQNSSFPIIQSISGLFSKMIIINPNTLISDFFGVLFYPQNHSIGILLIVPLFLITAIIISGLFIFGRVQFTSEDKRFIIPLLFLAGSVFFAYGIIALNSLNTSHGIVPDIRYLSPIYVPLNILGLIFLKKTNLLIRNPISALQKMLTFWIFILPLSLIVTYYSFFMSDTKSLFIDILGVPFQMILIIIYTICLIGIVLNLCLKNKKTPINDYLIPIACALPFVWQINVSFLIGSFSIYAHYSFWIPFIRIAHETLAIIFIHI